jgi:uncharacterized protein (TIGR03905 family)
MSAGVDVTTLGGTPIEEQPVLPIEERLTDITPADAEEGHRVFNFKTDGSTCTTEFNVYLNGFVLENVEFLGGPCEGNSKAIIELVKGMKMGQCIKKCTGILCGGAGNVSSCPDQLAQGLTQILRVYKAEGMPDVPIDENGEFHPNCDGDCADCASTAVEGETCTGDCADCPLADALQK